jgi:hypothetical protein
MKVARLAAIAQTALGFVLALPGIAFAQATTGTSGGTSISGTGSAGCSAIMNSTAIQTGSGQLAGIVVFISGTPFKVAAALYFVVGIIALFLDNGHLPQIVKTLMIVFIGVAVVGLVVGFLFGSTSTIAQC